MGRSKRLSSKVSCIPTYLPSPLRKEKDERAQKYNAPPIFSVNDTFENLRKGVNQVEGFETSAFMWEWFTTKPFVDSGEVREDAAAL